MRRDGLRGRLVALAAGVCIVPALVGILAAQSAMAASENGEAAKAVEEAAAKAAEAQAEFVRSGETWSIDVDCALCHAVETLSCDDDELLMSKHAALECLDCHSDEAGLEGVHAKIKAKTRAPKRLKKTSVDDQICLTCHGPVEELVEATEESTVLTDKNGTTVNPHEAAALTPAHEEDGMGCESCHSMHIERDVQTYCGTCHHMEVYECFTCHG